MQGMLTEDQRQQLQRELTMLNDATQRYGIQTQAGTAGAALGQDWQRALLQNQQFLSNLGLQAQDQATKWDWLKQGGTV